ncbi:MAG: isoleucine--tRNA ligase [Kiritimatiellia bacterium]
MFQPVSSKTDFPSMERGILSFWEQNRTFAKSLEQRRDARDFVFYDGPPFATGLPHYGHLLAGTIKDIVPRYQTMRGFRVERRFGWDTHGLPIEALAQEALGVSGAPEIQKLGVGTFNEQCRSMVLKYVSQWRQTVTRMGRWVDFDRDYKTMDPTFMETIWWVFKQLWDQGRVYKSHRIMPYSWKLSTPLSNFEAGSNYKDVQDPAVTCRVKALSSPSPLVQGLLNQESALYLLIWTTTPWTLPENLAICAGGSIDYLAVRDLSDPARPAYVLAKARLATLFKKPEAYQILAEFKGSELKGTAYEPLFDYFLDQRGKGAFQVLNDDYVTTDDGVGLVHIAPAYGEDDYRVCKQNGIEAFADPLDASCAFTSQLPEYQGRFCKECDKDIIRRLKDEGKLVHQATIVHSYPFCDRTDTPLIYRAIDAWYVRVEDLRDRLAQNNATVHWTPAYVGDKRFGNWLREARDWNISRNRFWGSCIPVWINEANPDDQICIGSIAELEALSGQKVTDLHKHFVDQILIHRNGQTYRRTPEVLDCWFESGSMPYAQQHYPFEKKGREETFFPADFIAEGLDQTRGWFYTLMVLGTCLFGKSPYRNVVVNGLVLAEDGKKMSKRLKNYPDPNTLLETYGADAIRLYMICSPVVRAENLKFSESGVKQVLRDLLIPWWNAYSFFVTYANADGFREPEVRQPESTNLLDRWIVSSLETLAADVTGAMDDYDLQRAVRPFVRFVEDLTNWYIRRSRRRFWKSQNDADKLDAYRTLRYVLVQLSKIAAPFTPFISEEIYRNLRGQSDPESVHLCDFPTAREGARDLPLEAQMSAVQTIVRLGRQLRIENDLKVRQPLAALHIALADDPLREALSACTDLIADELNIKAVDLRADDAGLSEISLKPDFRKLGPKCGPRMKAVAAAIANLPPEQSAILARGGALEIEGIPLTADDIQIRRTPKPGLIVASEDNLVVALETTLTPELLQEGLARELVSRIQALRKDHALEVSDRIHLALVGDQPLLQAAHAHAPWIQNETLALDLQFPGELPGEPIDINGHTAKIAINKA